MPQYFRANLTIAQSLTEAAQAAPDEGVAEDTPEGEESTADPTATPEVVEDTSGQ